ncbi:MAG: excinuclease ABC subunit UvrC [Pseudomonadota bacterium]
MFDYKAFLKTLSTKPGVYQMFDKHDKILYVGKAKNLKNRVSSYFVKTHASTKTQALVKQIHAIKVIITRTEYEALILESHLIKKFHPRYNILFRDDKSYPYIYLSSQHQFPRFSFYRGSTQGKKGKFFGPYPSTTAVHQTLQLIQKIFKIRQCRDTFFKNRQRPCLQYQIKRCSAPCVNYIAAADYQKDVDHAQLLLTGKNEQIINDLLKKMRQASDQQHYELAMKYRDQIADLRKLQASQHVATDVGDVDVIALVSKANISCVQLLLIRAGHIIGKQNFFPQLPKNSETQDILPHFLSHYYLDNDHQLPKEILVSQALDDAALLAQSIQHKTGKMIKISCPRRGAKLNLIQMATLNAKDSLNTRLLSRATLLKQLEAIQDILGLTQTPQRIECFDISHTQGEQTVASCVVFGAAGPIKKDYRRFNIQGITPGDDYAAIYQAVLRHYKKLRLQEAVLPDVVIIDGGRNQLKQAMNALEELQIDDIALLGIAKGKTRKVGFEQIFLAGKTRPLDFMPENIGIRLLLQARDEAHRFAISGHRHQRDNKRKHSVLELVPGVGEKRRQKLLQFFAGIQGVKEASIEDLARVPGIDKKLAGKIYQQFHG